MDRLVEHFLYADQFRKGFLPRKIVYTLLRGLRLPIDVQLLEAMLDEYVPHKCLTASIVRR